MIDLDYKILVTHTNTEYQQMYVVLSKIINLRNMYHIFCVIGPVETNLQNSQPAIQKHRNRQSEPFHRWKEVYCLKIIYTLNMKECKNEDQHQL